MSPLRDYVEWHRAYDDPSSNLSWRLRNVKAWLCEALDDHQGQARIVSACSGDGRDVIEVLASRPDASRVSATLIEIHPELAGRARERAAAAGLTGVQVREGDAGATGSYADAVPADVVLLVGIFGNISLDDIERTIKTTRQLCAPEATVLWTRGRDRGDYNDEIRGWFAESGFSELHYETLDADSKPAVGAVRYRGPAVPLVLGKRLFSFSY